MADLDALVVSPWWRWMDGMLATGPGWFGNARIVEVDGDGDPCLWTYRGYVRGPAASSNAADTSPWDSPEARPVVTDPATVGCLLALAREAWSCDQYRRLTIEPAGAGWCVILRNGTHRPPSRAAPGWRLDRATGAWPANCAPAWGDGPFCTEADALIAAILAAPPPGVTRG